MSELNAEIDRLLGYEVRSGVAHYDGTKMAWTVYVDANGASHNPIKWDSDPAAALGLLEHVCALNDHRVPKFEIVIRRRSSSDRQWYVVILPFVRPDSREWRGTADTLPEAIALACRDALRALAEETTP